MCARDIVVRHTYTAQGAGAMGHAAECSAGWQAALSVRRVLCRNRYTPDRHIVIRHKNTAREMGRRRRDGSLCSGSTASTKGVMMQVWLQRVQAGVSLLGWQHIRSSAGGFRSKGVACRVRCNATVPLHCRGP